MREPVEQRKHLTVEEYLTLEETATVRHEYVGGNVFAMTGATKRHNRIINNVFRKLDDATEGGPCQVYSESVKLRVARDVIYYPDVMVTCEPDDDPLIESNPCLVVEVVSPSTEGTDRREKLLAYRNLPSFGAYLVVDQDRRRVEHYFRDPAGEWRRNNLVDDRNILVPCPPETFLTFDDIYRGLDATP